MHILKIDLDALAAAFDNTGSNISYLDLDSGEIVLRHPDQPAPGESDKYNIEPERYLRIEPLTPTEQLEMRELFLAGVGDPPAHAALSQALAGRKALRSFHYALEQFPLAQASWQRYHAQTLRQICLEWLLENGLEAAPEPPRLRPPVRTPALR
jgi:hypothetical protein